MMLQLFYCFNHGKRGKTQKTFSNSIFLSDLLKWLYSSILSPALYSIWLVKFLGVRGSWVLVLLNFPHHWELPMVIALSPGPTTGQTLSPSSSTLIMAKKCPAGGWMWWQGRIYPSVLFRYFTELTIHHNFHILTKFLLSAATPVGSPGLLTAPITKHPLCCSEGAGIGGWSALARVKKADTSM